MAIYCRGSNVAEIYRRGTKVLQVYKKGALVYDAGGGEAFGGYVKDGLVLQLDCRRIEVDGEPKISLFDVGHEYVDLGLPSGNLWATCNVGAENPEDAGGYYAWGETKEKDSYTWQNYKYIDSDNRLTKYVRTEESGIVDGKSTLDPEDDVVKVLWGGDWRIPTEADLVELINRCSFFLTTYNDKACYRVTGPNGNVMYMPLSGYKERTSLYPSSAYYWDDELAQSRDDFAFALNLDNYNRKSRPTIGRFTGASIRPVKSKKVGVDWFDLIKGAKAIIYDAVVSDEGISGGYVELPSVDGVVYVEVTKLSNDEFVTDVSSTLPSTINVDGTLYSIRAYNRPLIDEEREHNRQKDIENFGGQPPVVDRVFADEFSEEFE